MEQTSVPSKKRNLTIKIVSDSNIHITIWVFNVTQYATKSNVSRKITQKPMQKQLYKEHILIQPKEYKKSIIKQTITGSLIVITGYFCWCQHNFMLMLTNVLLMSINIIHDKIGNWSCWYQQEKGKTEKTKMIWAKGSWPSL